MKKELIWIAAALMLLGIALFTVVLFIVDFDFMSLNNVKLITNIYEFSDESFNQIDINTITADIEFRKSEDGICRVVCYEREKMPHEVYIKDNTLTISAKDTRNWKDHITIFNFKTPTVTVYLPEGQYNTLNVENTTGNIDICGSWSFDSLELATTTGDVHVKDLSCRGDASARVTTGDITLENITCNNLTAKGSTGDAVLKNVIVADTMRVKRTTGDIKLDKCDAAEVYINATTGDVSGTLLTPKVIFASTTTGNVDVPKFTTGGRCEITVTTGDIRINIP
jgi:DUF4097 and DUF4098 domain-containing protein YvlB